jgi:hypothetical protein
MNTKVKGAAINVNKAILGTFEAINDQVTKPIAFEARDELSGFFASPRLGAIPKELAREDLHRARQENKLDVMSHEDAQKSEKGAQEIAQKFSETIQFEYKKFGTNTDREQSSVNEKLEGLKEEVSMLAKASGIDTKAHIERTPKNAGVLLIKLLTSIVRSLRIKKEKTKSAQDLVSQRSNAKRTTGMLAWVSGKQMKVHEQGTLTLQG